MSEAKPIDVAGETTGSFLRLWQPDCLPVNLVERLAKRVMEKLTAVSGFDEAEATVEQVDGFCQLHSAYTNFAGILVMIHSDGHSHVESASKIQAQVIMAVHKWAEEGSLVYGQDFLKVKGKEEGTETITFNKALFRNLYLPYLRAIVRSKEGDGRYRSQVEHVSPLIDLSTELDMWQKRHAKAKATGTSQAQLEAQTAGRGRAVNGRAWEIQAAIELECNNAMEALLTTHYGEPEA